MSRLWTQLRFALAIVLLAVLASTAWTSAGASTLLYDFDPNTLGGAAGSSVATLTDSVGGVVAFSQATGANQPIISTTAIGGVKTLHSTGSMWMATGTFAALPAGSTVFFVWQQTTKVDWQYPISFHSGGANGGILSDNVGFFSTDGSTPLGYHTQGATNTYIMEIVENGSSSEFRINGTLAYIGSIGAFTAVTQLGFFTANPGSLVFGMAGDFARMQVYSAITGGERATVRNSLGATYGVTIDSTTDVRFTASTGTLAVSTAAYRIYQSANYNAAVPSIVGIICHGSGGSPSIMYNTVGIGCFEDAILSQGGVVAACQLATTYTQTTLNNDIAAVEELIAFLVSNYNVKCVILSGQSRGGVASTIVLARNTSGKCTGWIGYFAALDGPTWYSTTDPTTNPLTRSASDFAGKWMEFNASTSDITVSKSGNSDAMYSHVAGHVAERTNVVCAGAHGDVSHYGYNRYLAFVKRAAGVTPEYGVTGPSSGASGVASTAFTLALANATVTDAGNSTTPTISSSLTFDGQYFLGLAPSSGTITATAAGGTITGNGTASVVVTPVSGATNFTFTFTPSSGGAKTISTTNGQLWANPVSQSYTSIGLFRRGGGRAGSRSIGDLYPGIGYVMPQWAAQEVLECFVH